MDYKEFRSKYIYSPDTLLGRGAFGTAYLASLASDSKKKFVVKESLHKKGQRFSLDDEVNRAKKIRRHPNIIHYDFSYKFRVRKKQLSCAVMPYMNYGDIRNVLDNYSLSLEEKKVLIQDIVCGLEHLHRAGTIHAGLAPSNILIQRKNDQWTARISHFGLNHISDKPPLLYSDYSHNIEYNAPEQILNESISYAVDLWSLGTILFEIFSDKHLFESSYDKEQNLVGYRKDVFKKIISVSFSSDELSKIPEPYQSIIYYCLQRNPNRRIQKVSGIRDMMERFDSRSGPEVGVMALRNYIREHLIEPHAIPYTLTKEHIELPSRSRFLSKRFVLISSLFLIAAGLVWLYIFIFHDEDTLPTRKEKNVDISEKKEVSDKFLEEASSNIIQINSASEDGIIGNDDQEEGDEDEFYTSPFPTNTKENTNTIDPPTESQVNKVQKKKSYKPQYYTFFNVVKAHDGRVSKIKKIKKNKEKIASIGWDNKVKIWDLSSKKISVSEVNTGIDRPFSIAISPDNGLFATGSWQDITIWSLPEMKKIKVLKGHTDDVESLAFSQDGKFLVSGSWDHSIKVWDVEKGVTINNIKVHTSQIEEVAYHPKKNLIASLNKNNKVYIFDPAKRKGKEKAKEVELVLNVGGVGLNDKSTIKNEGEQIAVTENMEVIAGNKKLDKSNKLDIATLKNMQDKKDFLSERLTFKPPESYAKKTRTLAFSPDGKYIAVAKYDIIQIWNASTGKLDRTLKGHQGIVYSICFHPSQPYIISGGQDRTIKVWNYVNGKLIKTLSGHKDEVLSVSFDNEGEKIFSGSRENNIYIWEIKEPKKKKKFSAKKLKKQKKKAK